MKEAFPKTFNNIDSLLSDLESSKKNNEVLSEIDFLCSEIDNGFKKRTKEITEMPIQTKRTEVVDSKDAHLLNTLSMDENFNIRSLSGCNSEMPEASLRRLVENSSDYIKMIVANNPNSPSDLLDRIAELTSEKEVLDAVKIHPNVSAVTKYKIETRETA